MCIKNLEKCLGCDSFDYQCPLYFPSENEECVWGSYVDRNLKEILQTLREHYEREENEGFKY